MILGFLFIQLLFASPAFLSERCKNFHEINMLHEMPASELKAQANRGHGKYIFLYSLSLKYGINGIEKNQELAEELIKLARTKYHPETIAIVNGFPIIRQKRDIEDEEMNRIENCFLQKSK